MDGTTAYVLLVIFVATLIRSAFGFGEALVAVPLLAIRLPISVAAPLAVLVSITVAAVIIAQDWRHIHLRSAGWLVLSTLFGIPLGLMLLTQGNHALVKGTLAVIIVIFSAFALMGRKPPELHSDNRIWLLACGFCAGVLGGAYGMNGPPLAIYGAMRRWSAQHFRATLQGYFLPASLIGMGGYWLAGLWVTAVTRYYLFSLPLIIPAILLGRAVNHRLRGDAFLKFVHAGLILIGGDSVGAGDPRLGRCCGTQTDGFRTRGHHWVPHSSRLCLSGDFDFFDARDYQHRGSCSQCQSKHETCGQPVTVQSAELGQPICEIERCCYEQAAPRDSARQLHHQSSRRPDVDTQAARADRDASAKQVERTLCLLMADQGETALQGESEFRRVGNQPRHCAGHSGERERSHRQPVAME